MEPDAVAIAARVLSVFEKLGIAYVVGGSLASSVHGVPRATNDVDVVADVRREHAAVVARLLQGEFYVEPATIAEAIERGGSFNLIHLETAFKVDVFVCGEDWFRREQVARGRAQDVTGSLLRLQSAEDTVLAKLAWYRAGGEVSDRQWSDAVGVARVQGAGLDLGYLRAEAARLDVLDLLDRALAEAQE